MSIHSQRYRWCHRPVVQRCQSPGHLRPYTGLRLVHQPRLKRWRKRGAVKDNVSWFCSKFELQKDEDTRSLDDDCHRQSDRARLSTTHLHGPDEIRPKSWAGAAIRMEREASIGSMGLDRYGPRLAAAERSVQNLGPTRHECCAIEVWTHVNWDASLRQSSGNPDCRE